MDQQLRPLILRDLFRFLDSFLLRGKHSCCLRATCTLDGPSTLRWDNVLVTLLRHGVLPRSTLCAGHNVNVTSILCPVKASEGPLGVMARPAARRREFDAADTLSSHRRELMSPEDVRSRVTAGISNPGVDAYLGQLPLLSRTNLLGEGCNIVVGVVAERFTSSVEQVLAVHEGDCTHG